MVGMGWGVTNIENTDINVFWYFRHTGGVALGMEMLLLILIPVFLDTIYLNMTTFRP